MMIAVTNFHLGINYCKYGLNLLSANLSARLLVLVSPVCVLIISRVI